jgi:hypothetical protein
MPRFGALREDVREQRKADTEELHNLFPFQILIL